MSNEKSCKHEWVQVCGEAVCKTCNKYLGGCFVDVERKDCLGLEDQPQMEKKH